MWGVEMNFSGRVTGSDGSHVAIQEHSDKRNVLCGPIW